MFISGYTPGYLNSYVYGPTVVYGTGFYYSPWYGAYYYPRPWSWGFNFGYTPYFGWGFGWGYSAAWFEVSVLVMDTVTDMGTEVVDGGVRLTIIPLIGVAGMAATDLMDSMEIISMYIMVFM